MGVSDLIVMSRRASHAGSSGDVEDWRGGHGSTLMPWVASIRPLSSLEPLVIVLGGSPLSRYLQAPAMHEAGLGPPGR